MNAHREPLPSLLDTIFRQVYPMQPFWLRSPSDEIVKPLTWPTADIQNLQLIQAVYSSASQSPQGQNFPSLEQLQVRCIKNRITISQATATLIDGTNPCGLTFLALNIR